MTGSRGIMRKEADMAGSYNICLDIGGTKVLGAIFDRNARLSGALRRRRRGTAIRRRTSRM